MNGSESLWAPRIPVQVVPDRTLRIKVIDTCGLACTFCHNEGTPVTVDALRIRRGESTKTGRVSIYERTNGVSFLADRAEPDEGFTTAVRQLIQRFGIEEIHLTGGEPTLHPRLSDIVAALRSLGVVVGMTSNGENGAKTLANCALAGLQRVNFSIFGTTPEELASVQGFAFADPHRAKKKIAALQASIEVATSAGVSVSANLVVPDMSHEQRVRRLLGEYSPKLQVRLLNSLDQGDRSIIAIFRILERLGARSINHRVTAGASGYRTVFHLTDGREIHFKRIRSVRLPDTCASCQWNNPKDCQEGYYGLRMYRATDGRYMVGVCIQRMDLCQPVEQFVNSPLAEEVIRLRRTELMNTSEANDGALLGKHEFAAKR
ncbi:MAG: radical SAM protein [Corynebacteriales bacterium]|nr:radical SAM protein [Mycobacteriales bacterium]